VLIIHETDSAPADGQRSVITIGAYDGVHRGHQAVIAQVRNEAARLGCRSIVVTFDRHPASVVRPESAPKLLTDIDQKMAALAATGVDATFVARFDADAAQEDPAEFVRRVLVQKLRAQLIVVGEDFHFGYKRGGNVALLRELGKEHDFEVVPVQLIARPDGVAEPVSSTSIRRALAGGQVEVAANLLGRPFSVSAGAPLVSPQPTSKYPMPCACRLMVCTRASFNAPTVLHMFAQSTLVDDQRFLNTLIIRCWKHTCLISTAICMASECRSRSSTSCAASESLRASNR
jgi:phosphopantetheine adenylyltransferase